MAVRTSTSSVRQTKRLLPSHRDKMRNAALEQPNSHTTDH